MKQQQGPSGTPAPKKDVPPPTQPKRLQGHGQKDTDHILGKHLQSLQEGADAANAERPEAGVIMGQPDGKP
ncbi:MAG: hypothetical protein ABSB41_03965 [Anaerolineales bacterium]|jgi:hypothetical protein